MAFLTAGVFYDGGSGPPRGQRSSIFSLSTLGVHPQSVCLSVVSLSHRPSPNKNPAFLWQWRVLSGLPASRSQSEQQSFSSAFIGNDRFIPSPLTRSSDNSLSSSRYSRPSANLSPIGWSSPSNPGGLRWSPHLLPILCS